MISITQFKKVFYNKYNGKMPIYKILYHFPDSKTEEIPSFIKELKLKIVNGYIVNDVDG